MYKFLFLALTVVAPPYIHREPYLEEPSSLSDPGRYILYNPTAHRIRMKVDCGTNWYEPVYFTIPAKLSMGVQIKDAKGENLKYCELDSYTILKGKR